MKKMMNTTTSLTDVVDYLQMVVIEPKVNPKKKRKISEYKETKLGKHTTKNGVGTIGKLIRKK